MKLLNTNRGIDRLALFLIAFFTEHLPLVAAKIKRVAKGMKVQELLDIAQQVEPDYEFAVTSVIYKYCFATVIDMLAEESSSLDAYVDNVVKLTRVAGKYSLQGRDGIFTIPTHYAS